jgi:cytochrome c556
MRPSLRGTLVIVLALAAATLVAPVAAQEEGPPDAPATALRVAVDRTLGEHAFLLGEVVRSGIVEGPEFEAAAAALDENSSELIAVITEVYGEEAGRAFAELWHDHIAYIVDYGRAVEAGQADAAHLASVQLDRYVNEFSGFLAGALPALPPDTVQGLIGEHVQQLEHVASFEEADFGGAYQAIRQTYAHMFGVGDGLTIGIVSLFPDRFPGQFEAFSPATNLRITLDRQLGEHSYLASLAMRAVLRDAEDVSSAADALAANSADLQATIADVYGEEAGAAFARLWENHVASYVAYVTAIAEGDASSADAALQELSQYQTDFTAYVAQANPFVSGDAFETLIGQHTHHLVAQADAYASGNYDASYRLGREAYAHSGELSKSLAGAIADQFPLLFPDTAGRQPTAPIGLVGAGLLAMSAMLVAVRAIRMPRTSPVRHPPGV